MQIHQPFPFSPRWPQHLTLKHLSVRTGLWWHFVLFPTFRMYLVSISHSSISPSSLYYLLTEALWYSFIYSGLGLNVPAQKAEAKGSLPPCLLVAGEASFVCFEDQWLFWITSLTFFPLRCSWFSLSDSNYIVGCLLCLTVYLEYFSQSFYNFSFDLDH